MKKYKYLVLLVAVIIIGDGIVNNFYITTTEYNLTSDKVDEEYTFIQISDYHSNDSQSDKLIEQTKANNPDYILLSWDILESPEMNSTIQFIEKLTDVAPVIYARGNHDDDYNTYQQFKTELNDLGVIIVDSTNYQIGDLNFIGIEDYSGASLFKYNSFADTYSQYISSYSQFVDSDKYNVLLAHRPNFLEEYANLGVDLVVSGHAHGGQWQIPFTDIGFIAPDEGIFPTHVHGQEQLGNTTQIISSGTSNPYGPWIPRLFNPEEVVVINLRPSK